jgi:hypothetical protein
MPYEAHSELETPPDDTVLWRYLSFVKFMDLIERRHLWFARLDTFEDPLEGTHTDAEVEYIRAQPVPLSPDPALTLERQYMSMTRLYRETMFVNCWRASSTESMAMWDIYGKDSGVVAIKSTVGLLKEILRGYSHPVFIGRVKYVNWNEIAWHLNALAMVMRKDRSYEHEQELRAVIWGLAVESNAAPMVTYSLSPEGKVTLSGPPGVEIPCDPNKLVAEIKIGPREQEMFYKVLDPILRRYGITAPVTVSDRLKTRSSK